jgi:hypothetical protein
MLFMAMAPQRRSCALAVASNLLSCGDIAIKSELFAFPGTGTLTRGTGPAPWNLFALVALPDWTKF